MKCPHCQSPRSKVEMNWPVGWVIVRIRKCLDCEKEFQTQEKVATSQEKADPGS